MLETSPLESPRIIRANHHVQGADAAPDTLQMAKFAASRRDSRLWLKKNRCNHPLRLSGWGTREGLRRSVGLPGISPMNRSLQGVAINISASAVADRSFDIITPGEHQQIGW